MRPHLVPIFPTGGVNRLSDPRRIDDSECVTSQNLVPYTKGMLSKRPALGPVNDMQFNMGNEQIVGMMIPPFETAAQAIVAYRSVLNGATSGVLVLPGGTAAGAYGFGAVTRGRPCMVSYRKGVYVLPGYPIGLTQGGQPPVPMVLVHNIAQPTYPVEIIAKPFQGVGNNFAPSGMVIFNDRPVFWDLGPGYEDYLLWADPGDPTLIRDNALAANGAAVRIGAFDGDRIVGCVEIMQTQTSGPTQRALLVLKQYSAFIINGEPSKTTEPIDFSNMSVEKISYDCGCSSFETITKTPYGVFWASWDDVWMFVTGAVPVRVGTKIRPVLAQTPAATRYLWHAAYFNGFYRLAVMSPGQGPTDDDPCGEQWWLDLRDGPPESHQTARWWGPQVYFPASTPDTAAIQGTRVMAVDTRPGHEPALYGAEKGVNSVPNPTVWLYSYDSGNQAFDRDVIYPLTTVSPSEGGGLVNVSHMIANEIATELKTKDYDFDDPFVQKIYEGLEIWSQTSVPAWLQVETILDGARSIEAMGKALSQTGFLGDVDVLDADAGPNPDDQYRRGIWRPGTTSRKRGLTIQFRIKDLTGYVVDDTNYQFDFIRGAGGSINTTATLTKGYYTDLVSFLDMIVAAMNLVDANGYHHNQTQPPRPELVIITGNATWQPIFVISGDLYPDIRRRTRIIGAVLGYATSANPALALAQTAASSVHLKQSTALKLGSIIARIRGTHRRVP